MKNSKEKLQLVGRIKNMPNGNKEQFEKYKKIYEDLGYEVFSPHSLKDQYPDLDEVQYMGICLQNISNCNVIVVCPGWENSRGAKLEVFFALTYGIKVLEASTKNPICFKNCTIEVSKDENFVQCNFGCNKIELDVYMNLTKKEKTFNK